jgi:hypothetical protein
MKTIVTAALLTAMIGVVSAPAFAADFAATHPRRAEVNHRINHENAKTSREVRDGKLTAQQGRQLHREDHQVRTEERSMASQDGGHITSQEKATLNQQENGINAQRRADIRANQ